MEQEQQWQVNYKQVTVKMSDGLLYKGKLNTRNFQRLSDFFRHTDDRFLVMISESNESEKVVMLNRNYIVWAETED